MKLLIIGSGGREHALAWKLAQEERITRIHIAPGNGGTQTDGKIKNVLVSELAKGYSHEALQSIANYAEKEKIAFTIVGPEAPLAEGIVNLFQKYGLKIFGPTKEAAQLESSKAFAKAFMERHKIPTATYQAFDNSDLAREYVQSNGVPIVIKADGLAAGKGVFIAFNLEEAYRAIDTLFDKNASNTLGARVVIESYLDGEEASFIVMVDGKNVLALASSQDHKRLLDGDKGPNTGGMGAYSPAPIITPELHARVMREIIMPTVRGMEKENLRFTGFLYAGLMIDNQGNPKVLEFNCRMGDPETQPIMVRLKSEFSKTVEHAIAGTLDQVELNWDRRIALGVVLSAAGYPEQPRQNDLITGIPNDTESTITFHAGTKYDENNNQLYTSGGRVLSVVGLADSIRSAQEKAYETINKIKFEGMQYRHDIGYRALNRK